MGFKCPRWSLEISIVYNLWVLKLSSSMNIDVVDVLGYRLDHSPLLILMKEGSEGHTLHGGW